MDGAQDDRTSAGSRRDFLKTAAASGGAAALVAGESAWAAQPEAVKPSLPTVTLGKTGQKVTVLGQGTSWTLQPAFLQAAFFSGVRYVDCSENYERGRCEKTLGEVLERTKMRKDVYLVSKCGRKVGGAGAYANYEQHLNASLERLKTDYIDSYYLHGITGAEIPLLHDPEVKAAFEKLKKSGKIRFCGLSCHDRRLPEVVEAAAECGWIDQIMIQYNYRTMGVDDVKRAVDAASKANLGIVAMKTQGGAGSFREEDSAPKFKEFLDKGFKKEQSAIKTVLSDHRIHVVVSEMTNRDMLRENMAASADHTLSSRDQKLLEEYRLATSHLYCHGCGHNCEPAAGGVAVADILRFLRYDEVYGKRRRARELYQTLPQEARNLVAADLAAAQAACPHGLPVVELLRRADQRMG
ncbi:MAG: aldo/keto reductase [Isosphaeraceae bacterium]